MSLELFTSTSSKPPHGVGLALLFLVSITPRASLLAQVNVLFAIDDTTMIQQQATNYVNEPEFSLMHVLRAVPYGSNRTMYFLAANKSDTAMIAEVRGDTLECTEFWSNNRPRLTWLETKDTNGAKESRLVVVKYYCENGQVRRVIWEDRLIYPVASYYCNGNLEVRFMRVLNPKVQSGVVGPYERWYSDGKPWEYEEYDYSGQPTGVWKRWDEHGVLIQSIDHR